MGKVTLAASWHPAGEEEQAGAKQETALETPYDLSDQFPFSHEENTKSSLSFQGWCIHAGGRSIDAVRYPKETWAYVPCRPQIKVDHLDVCILE